MAKSKETETVRISEDDESPEQKHFDISKYIRGARSSQEDEDENDLIDPKAAKARQKREEAEEKAHQAELDKQAAEFAPILLAVGAQATDRLTPAMPYKYDEALTLSKALTNFADKHSDGVLGEWKEEIALVLIGASQIVPRVMMWRAQQVPVMRQTAVPESVQSGHQA